MPKRDHRDLAGLLLRKASGDEAALSALSREDAVPDEVVGFHAQQEAIGTGDRRPDARPTWMVA